MDKQLKDKKILLLGCSGILGAEFTDFLYKNGAHLILADLRSKKFNKLKKNYPKSYCIHCDVTKENDIKKLKSAIKKKFNYLDSIIYNVGLTSNFSILKKNSFPEFQKYSLKDWNLAISTNLTGAFLLAKHNISFLEKKSGSLLFVASIYGKFAPDFRIYKFQKFKTLASYSASKAGLLGLAKWLAVNYAHKNIRVNTIVPGGIFSKQNKMFVKNYSQRVPMNRMGNKNEINGILSYLISEKSSYVTGQDFIIDGGMSAW